MNQGGRNIRCHIRPFVRAEGYSAKSNVVNNNRITPDNPPMKDTLDQIANSLNFFVEDNRTRIWEVEAFIRNFAALGSCTF